jgi:hypothetical protein
MFLAERQPAANRGLSGSGEGRIPASALAGLPGDLFPLRCRESRLTAFLTAYS